MVVYKCPRCGRSLSEEEYQQALLAATVPREVDDDATTCEVCGKPIKK